MKSYSYKLPNEIELNRSQMLLIGPLGESSIKFLKKGICKIEDKTIYFKSKQFLGFKTILDTKVKGLIFGFKLELNLFGIGYRAQIQNSNLILQLGYSHPILIQIPKMIEIFLENEKTLILYGIDYEILTNFGAKLIKLRSMNIFTGHGIKYKNDLFF